MAGCHKHWTRGASHGCLPSAAVPQHAHSRQGRSPACTYNSNSTLQLCGTLSWREGPAGYTTSQQQTQHKHTPLTAHVWEVQGGVVWCDAAVLPSREHEHRRGTLLPAHLYRVTTHCLADVDQALVYMRVASTRYSLMPRYNRTAKPRRSNSGCVGVTCCRPLNHCQTSTQPGMLSCACPGFCSHAPRPTTRDNAQALSVHRHTFGPAACAATEPPQPSSASSSSLTTTTTSQLDNNSQCTQRVGAPGGGATHAGMPCGQQARW